MSASSASTRAFGVALLLLLSSGCLRLDVGSDGPVLAATPVSVESSIVRCPIAVSPSSDGASYAVIWQEHVSSWREFKFARVTGSGRLLTEPSEIVPFDGAIDQLWLYTTEEGFRAFYAAGGAVRAVGLTPEGEAKRSAVDVGWYPEPVRVVQTDEGYAVFYPSDGTAYLVPLDETGAPAGEPRTPMPAPEEGQALMQEQQAVYMPGDGYHMVWRDDDGGADIGYARLSSSAELDYTSRIDFGSHKQIRIVEDGVGRLVLAWLDSEGRVSLFSMEADGDRVWPSAQRASQPNRRKSMSYDLAGGGGRVGVAWESDAETVLPQIMLATYDVDEPGSPEPLPLTEPAYGFTCPSIARGPGSFAVAFRGEVRGSQRLFVDVYED